jgi:sulfur relay (sulfurtransferase) complex TusBCD TusD component (DsrE family)
MKSPRYAALLLATCAIFSVVPVLAADSDPLFVNMTTDDAYRSTLAITVSARMLERGHPLTIFFNDRGIFVASRKNAEKFPDQQAMLVKLAQAGATLLACPNCMKHYGIAESDLVEGITVGSAQITGDALFRDDTKTLSW